MATEVCDEQDTGSGLGSAFFGPSGATLDDPPAVGTGTLFYSIPGNLFDTGTATETAYPEGYSPLYATGTLGDEVTPTNRAILDQFDAALLGDEVVVYSVGNLFDTGTGGELVDYFSALLAQDTGTFGDVLSASTRVVYDAVDTGLVSDTIYEAKSGNLFDTGTFSDTLYDLRQRIDLLSDTGTLGDVIYDTRRLTELLADRGTFGDTLLPVRRATVDVIEELLSESGAVFNSTNAWTTNTDTWAATRYELPEMRGLASRGDLYATGPSGLLRFGGTTDLGAQIPAYFDGHLNDLGTDRLKNARSMYMGYSSERPLTVRISVTYDGVETAYDYEMPERAADSWVPGRVKLGRGLRSRYMRYRVSNTDGGAFAVDEVVLDVDVSTRRV